MFFGPKKGKTLSIAVKKFILRVKIFILRVSKSRELVKNLLEVGRQILKKHKNSSSAALPQTEFEGNPTTFPVKKASVSGRPRKF